jgi:hypothetical protein
LTELPADVQVARATSRGQDVQAIELNTMPAQNGKTLFSMASISQYLLGA